MSTTGFVQRIPSFYTGNKDELQQALALVEGLTAQADQLAEKAKKVGAP